MSERLKVDSERVRREFREDLSRRIQGQPVTPAGLLGLECEYRVYEDNNPVDFRHLLPILIRESDGLLRGERELMGRLSGGQLLTCDGWEAEISTPSEELGLNGPTRLAQRLIQAQNAVLEALADHSRRSGRRYTLRGCSSHFNFSAGSEHANLDTARRFLLRFGPLILLMTCLPSSRSIACRPRRERIEIITEYVGSPERLRACIALFASCVMLAMDSSELADLLPQLCEESVTPYPVGGGWRLALADAGTDLRRTKRDGLLKSANGGELSLQRWVQLFWNRIQPFAKKHWSASEIALVRRYVSGAQLGGLELDSGDQEKVSYARAPLRWQSSQHVLFAVSDARTIGAWKLQAAFVHWDFTVFACRFGGGELFLNLPGRYLPGYLEGRFDDTIAGGLQDLAPSLPQTGMAATLASVDDTVAPGLFQALDAVALARSLKQYSGGKKPKRLKRLDSCRVTKDAAGRIFIDIPRTMDPLQLRPQIQQEPPQHDVSIAQGVWVHNLTFGHTHVDHHVKSLGFDFSFERHYRSGIDYDGILGLGWEHGYNIRVVTTPPPPSNRILLQGGWREEFGPHKKSGDLTYYHGTGRKTLHPFVSWETRSIKWVNGESNAIIEFKAIVTTYAQNNGDDFYIERYAVLAGTRPDAVGNEAVFYRIRQRGGGRLLLNCHGYVVEIRDKNLNSMRFGYGEPVNRSTLYKVLRTIEDSCHRSYALDYKAVRGVPRIERLREASPGNRLVTFKYDSKAQLKEVQLAEGAAGRPDLNYRYSTTGRLGRLTEIVNPVEVQQFRQPHPPPLSGQTLPTEPYSWLENTYGGDRIRSQRVGAPPNHPQPSGGVFNFLPSGDKVVFTDRANVQWTYVLFSQGDTKLVRSLSVADRVFDAALGTVSRVLTHEYDYDDQFHRTLVKRPSGRREVYEFRLQNSNIPITESQEFDNLDSPQFTYKNDLSRDDLLSVTEFPSSGTESFTTTYQYERLFNAIKEIRDPSGAMTVFAYDLATITAPERNGNPVSVTLPEQKMLDGSVPKPVEKLEYGEGGIVKSFTDADEIKQEYEPYTDQYRIGMVHIHRIGGEIEAIYEYDNFRRITNQWDNRGKKWGFDYDARDNVIGVKTPLWIKAADPKHREKREYNRNDWIIRKTQQLFDEDGTLLGPGDLVARREFVEILDDDILGNRLRLTHQSQSTSRSWEWRYDESERVVLASTPRATTAFVSLRRPDARVRYAYNARGLQSAITLADNHGVHVDHPNSGESTMDYDADGLPVRNTYVAKRVAGQPPVRRSLVTVYDGFGRVLTEQHPDQVKIQRRYKGKSCYHEWVEGSVRTDPTAQPAQVILRDTFFERDHDERILTRTEMVFAPKNRPVPPDEKQFAEPDPAMPKEIWRTEHSRAGRLRTTEDSAGRQTTYQPNAQGRVHTVSQPGGHTVTFHYSGALPTDVTTTLSPGSGATALPSMPSRSPIVIQEKKSYDDLGRTIRVESQNCAIDMAYDSLGNLRAKATSLGKRVFFYDPFLRQNVERIYGVDPHDATVFYQVEFQYDLNDNRTSLIGAGNRNTVATYDGRDQMLTLTQPDQPEIVIERRADGLLKTMTKGLKTATYTYTAAGQVSEIVTEDNTGTVHQAYGYDGLGHLNWSTDDNGGSNSALPLSTTRSPEVLVQREYDSLGRLLSEHTSAPAVFHDKTVQYTYSVQKGFEEKTLIYPDGNEVTYRWGDDGNLSEMRRGSRVTASKILTQVHCGPRRLLETNYSLDNQSKVKLLEAYRYDKFGRLENRNLYINDMQYGGGKLLALTERDRAESYSYGTHGMMSQQVLPPILRPGAAIPSVTLAFHYDGASRLHLFEENNPLQKSSTQYGWDGSNRPQSRTITTGQPPQTTVTTFNYSQQPLPPRPIRDDFTQGAGPRWTFDPQYRVMKYNDTNRGVQRELVYDAADRLRKIDINAPSVHAEYLYDGLGRLIARVIGLLGTPHPWDVFLYDAERCIVEYSDWQGTESRRYVYDDLGRVVDYRSNGRYLPISRSDGTPWLVLERFRIAPGPPPAGVLPSALLQHYISLREVHQFDPFATSLTALRGGLSSLPPDLRIGVGGRRYFPDENLYYNFGSFTSPELGARLVPDSKGDWADPHTLGNPTAYAGQNPIALSGDGRPNGISGGIVAGTAASSAAVGIGMTLGAVALAFFVPVTAPFITFGFLVTGYSNARLAYEGRNLLAVENGVPASSAWIALTAGLDVAGLSGFAEGYTGRDLVTNQVLSSEDRSERLGGSIGGAVGTGFGLVVGSLFSVTRRWTRISSEIRTVAGTEISRNVARLKAYVGEGGVCNPCLERGNLYAKKIVSRKTGAEWKQPAAINAMKEQKGVLFGLGRFKMSRWVVEGAIKTFGNQGLDSLLHGVGERAGKLAIVEFKFGKAGGRNLAKVKEICSFYGIARRLGDAGRMDLYLELLAGNVESYACFEQGNVLMRINLDVLQHDSDWGKPGAYTILPGGFEP